jgi:hypothetical protein
MDGKLNLKDEQEILMNTADLMVDVFNAESLLLRVEKLNDILDKKNKQEVYDAMLQVFYADATARIHKFATDAIASFAEGDLLRTFLMGLKRFTKYPAVNVKEKRRLIADTMLESNSYCF